MSETIVAFLEWLAVPATLGVVSSWLTEAIKKVFVNVEDRVAAVVSIAVAAVLSIVAKLALPYANQIPPEIAAYWPIVVWAASQLWYTWTKERKPA